MEETLNRPADLVARYGGEEFIALLVDTEAEGARMLAERMRARVEGAARRAPRDRASAPYLTVSLGVATIVPRAAVRPEDLVDLADRALYAAKEGGRNRVVDRRRAAGRGGPREARRARRPRLSSSGRGAGPAAKLTPPQAASTQRAAATGRRGRRPRGSPPAARR